MKISIKRKKIPKLLLLIIWTVLIPNTVVFIGIFITGYCRLSGLKCYSPIPLTKENFIDYIIPITFVSVVILIAILFLNFLDKLRESKTRT